MYIDTHSHIYESEFQDDRQEVVQRAVEAGVGRIVLPDIDSGTRPRMLGLAEMYPGIMLPAIGLHPTSVNENYKQELAEVVHDLGTRSFCGIGECGIDLYWDKTWYREQVKVFEYQLGIAEDASLPVIIHSRDAAEDTMKIMEKAYEDGIKGVIHCYSYSPEMAQEYVKMGYFIGVGGVVTFKNAKKLVKTVEMIPLSSIVLETDCPYMAPEPHRGTRNDSRNIPYVIAKIAEIKGVSVEEVEQTTRENAFALFTKVPR